MSGTCPKCGYCRHCGRGGSYQWPEWYPWTAPWTPGYWLGGLNDNDTSWFNREATIGDPPQTIFMNPRTVTSRDSTYDPLPGFGCTKVDD